MGQRLLIVDNDQGFLREHRVALDSAFDVDTVQTTDPVLEMLESGKYAAVLISVEVEGRGYALCSAIRRQPSLQEMKVILISSKATEEEYARHQSLRGRADAYLHKPLLSSALVAALSPLVPAKAMDPDNPLGTIDDVDLGDEWLSGLKDDLVKDLETDLAPPVVEPELDIPAMEPELDIPMAEAATPLPKASNLFQTVALSMPSIPKVASPDAGKVELLEQRIQDLEGKLVGQQGEIKRLEQERMDLEIRYGAVTQNLENLEQRRADAEALALKLRAVEEEAGTLKEQNIRLSAQLEDLQAHQTTSHGTEGIDDLRDALSAKEEECVQMRADINGLEATLRAQRRELAEQFQAVDRMEKSRQEMESRLQMAEEGRTLLDADRERLNELVNGLTAERNALGAEVASLQEAREAATRLGEEKEGLEAELVRVRGDLVAAADRVAEQAVQLAATGNELQALRDERARQEEVVAELRPLATQVPDLHNQIMGLQQGQAALQRELADREEGIEGLRQEGTALRMELEDAQQEVRKAKDLLGTTQMALGDAEQTNAQLREDLGRKDMEYQAAVTALGAEQEKVAQALAELQGVQQVCGEARAEVDRLRGEEASVRGELEELRRAFEDERNELRRAFEDERNELRRAIEDQRNELGRALEAERNRSAALASTLETLVQQAQAALGQRDA